ncbi:MAG: acyl-CoA dehydrogenase [Acetobacteraceae bacterium]|nr:acyl-CoA dehydrogenase [Acetobacteraceae bacterium]
MTYAAPLRDMRFVLRDLVGLDRVAALPGCEHVGPELTDAILEEAGKFAAGVLAPLNVVGDRQGACHTNGVVTTADGFKEAYAQFVTGGWNALACEAEYGGQGLPAAVATPVEEMWQSANLAFSLCPLLTRGAVEALSLCGTVAQKSRYLHRMIEGSWTGTMNLTEPQAGSDLAAIRARAVPDGTFHRIHGQKIFITYGEHDLTDNIVHLVLARLPDAPEGVKGISLFVVPKFLVNDDGSLGARNDVRCVSIEHKLGIHASPTAVLAFGDNEGALGELIGDANRGLEYMFIMMNAARFAIGLQGVAIAERAYQQALAYARTRVQGTEIDVRNGTRVEIIRHPDVKRMLLEMKSRTEAMRALAYVTAATLDASRRHADDDERARQLARAELLIPVVKGWCTESAIEIASLGVQVHGGMGFIEGTGAAQHYRDARILTIYEGTTAIQANDLIGRKLTRDNGAAARALIAEIRVVAACGGAELADAITALETTVDWVLATHRQDPRATAAASVPVLKLLGIVAGGWQMARAARAATEALAAGDADENFLRAKLATVHFYETHILPQAAALAHVACHGGSATLDDSAFAA